MKNNFSAALFLVVCFAHAQNAALKIKMDKKAESLESK
jgi:hypothetical protein